MIERSGGVERVSKKGQIQGEMLSKIIVCVFLFSLFSLFCLTPCVLFCFVCFESWE